MSSESRGAHGGRHRVRSSPAQVWLNSADAPTERLPVVRPANYTPGNGRPPPLRRAVTLMAASGVLVPIAGVLTQPILAQGLGVEGRGQLAAALAPSLLAVAVATLGLPDALTYYLAKHPSITRPALLWATLVSGALGVACLALSYLALPFLSTGDPELGRLILLAVGLAVPALATGVFRGAASGRQMWGEVAAERYANIAVRIVGLGVLFALGQLTVFTALLVTALAPVIAGFVYWRLFLPPPRMVDEQPIVGSALRLVVSYGNRVWLGSVASMLLARLATLLMAPLSTLEDLGLYSVATTVSDVPLIVALAVAGALFGVNSARRDAAQIALTSRLTLLVSIVGCGALAAIAPLLISPVFGSGFDAAVVPTLMLLLSAVICVPGLMASIGINAWGRPGLRSIGLGITLVANLGVFLLLVPRTGVIGACWASIVGNVVLTGYMVVVAARVMKMPVGHFVLIRWSDVVRVWHEVRRPVARLRRVLSRG